MYRDNFAPEMPPELSQSLLRFFDASIDHILRHQDAERYLADLGDIVQISGIGEWFDASMPFWMLGRSVWNRVPLPSCNFQCAPLPAPQRNSPCPCGSDKKFKRCCQPFENEHTLSLEETLPIPRLAVEHFTKQQRQAAAKSAPAEVRLALAAYELETQHPGKARTLLLTMLKKGGLSAELQADAVPLLGSAYTALGHLDAGEKKLTALAPTLKPEAALHAYFWLTSRCLDDGRPQEAMAHVLHAEYLDPESLITGILKTLCLRELGADAQAQRTAQEWLLVAREIGEEEAIELLEEQASLAVLDGHASNDADWDRDPMDEEDTQPSDEAFALFGVPDEVLRPLVALLKEALDRPLYPVHFEPGPPSADGSETQWMLALPDPVEKAQAAFYQSGGAQNVLDVELIRRHSPLLQSPDFLEQLDAFAGAPMNRLQEQFNDALYEQQDRVLSHILDALPAVGQLPWTWLEHRPVLRLMMEMAMSQEDPDAEIELLSQLLALCPNDNLGARAPLVNALLREVRDAEALAICERYPDDALAETHYGRVLALVRLNRLHEAEQALASAHKSLPKVLTYLVANKRKEPRLNPHGITIGGADQAWYYRQEMRETFLATPGALSWMDNTRKKRLR